MKKYLNHFSKVMSLCLLTSLLLGTLNADAQRTIKKEPVKQAEVKQSGIKDDPCFKLSDEKYIRSSYSDIDEEDPLFAYELAKTLVVGDLAAKIESKVKAAVEVYVKKHTNEEGKTVRVKRLEKKAQAIAKEVLSGWNETCKKEERLADGGYRVYVGGEVLRDEVLDNIMDEVEEELEVEEGEIVVDEKPDVKIEEVKEEVKPAPTKDDKPAPAKDDNTEPVKPSPVKDETVPVKPAEVKPGELTSEDLKELRDILRSELESL